MAAPGIAGPSVSAIQDTEPLRPAVKRATGPEHPAGEAAHPDGLFGAVFNHAAAAIGVTDRAGRFVQTNLRLSELLGYSAAELRGKTFADLTHTDDVAPTQAHVARLLAGETAHDAIEKRYLRKDGSTIWCLTSVNALHDTAGQMCNLIGVIEELGERQLAGVTRSRLAAVVESSDDAIISKTLDGVITSWNRGAERIFGYSAQEIVGQPVTVLIPPELLDEEPVILERLKRGERIDHFETVRLRKGGASLNVSLTVSPLRDATGVIVGASKIARDITLQKRVEREAREQATVQGLLNTTSAAISAQLDLQALLQTVTDAATQLSGARYGAFFYNVADDKGGSYQLSALSGAPREAFERFGLPRNTPLFAPTFTGTGIVRSSDITADPRYGQLAPHHGMPAGHLRVCSYLAVPVVARSGAVLGGLFFGHPEPGVFTERSEQLVAGIAAQASIGLLNAQLYEAAQREIATREKAEAALIEMDRRKDEFLATLAHELRNPLAPIRQAALISSAEGATEAQKRWSHEVISRQVHHMSLLLEDLLDISRITRGMLALRIERTDLSTVIDAAVETARPALDAKAHDLTIELPPEPLQLDVDPMRLAQVLSNLLTNAAKYTDAHGKIRIHGTRVGDEIVIGVADNGIGIASESLEAVFAMFSQVKATQDRSDGGLGIGLALSKGLVALHGGTIRARSAGPGQGSEFVVRLPAGDSDRAVGDVQAERPAEPPGSPRRVLIADDNCDGAETLAILMRIEGHEVTVVYDGPSALAAFDTFQPDAVLLDIGMAGMSGYDVARQLRRKAARRAVMLVAITGWGQDSDKARAKAAGFDHHFTKPVEPGQLIALVASLGTAR
jgi:PAS domain S-box-containing protein